MYIVYPCIAVPDREAILTGIESASSASPNNTSSSQIISHPALLPSTCRISLPEARDCVAYERLQAWMVAERLRTSLDW
jgi:hypothetical protein